MHFARLAVPVALLLTACTAAQQQTPSPTPAITLSPTATPSASPTPSPSPSPSPTLSPSPSPTPTVAPTLTPTPTLPPAGWTEVTGFPSYGPDTHLASITFAGGQFVAVGWSGIGDATRGRVWTSTDGTTWQAQPDDVFTGLSLQAVTNHGTDLYAFASAPTTLWRSTDGSAWAQVDLPVGGGELGGGTVFDGGFVGAATTSGGVMYAAGVVGVVGGDIACDCAGMWRSSDGTNWQVTPVIDASLDQFMAFAVGGGLYPFAVGIGNGSYIGRAVMYTTDFEAWNAWDPADAGLDADASWGFIDAAGDSAGVVAVGYRGNAFDEPIALVTDGTTWSVATIDTATAALAEQVTWKAGQFVAVGTSHAGVNRTVAVSWTSADGVTWQPAKTVYDRPADPVGPEPGDDPINHRTIGSGDPGVLVAQTFADGLHVWFLAL